MDLSLVVLITGGGFLLGLLLGRWWLVPFPVASYGLFFFGYEQGWWGYGFGEGWLYAFVIWGFAGVVATVLGILLHPVLVRIRQGS